jgi:hypothetical protein
MGRARLLLYLLWAGCVTSTSNVCDNGSICPGGFVCDVENDRCLLPEQTSACEGLAELAECTFNGAAGACRAGACETYFCGDGLVTGGEDCDGENLSGGDCIDFNYYGVEGLACSASCKFDVTGCEVHDYCGDNEVNGPELCDGPQQRTCVAIGFDAGTASCNNSCGFSINDCSRFGWNPESLSDVIAYAVAGSARNDQWAFGANGRAMHYEGVFWNTVSTSVQNDLIRAWSNAKDDTWAVGQSRSSGPTLASTVIHWDGSAWSEVTGLPAAEYIDVWGASPTAVYVASTSGSGIYKFDGSAWSTLPSFVGEPIQIRGTSTTDIWVATKGGPLMHFDGASWIDRTPSGASIQDLDANSASDVWAIGHLTANQGTGVIAHYDGTAWTQFVTAQEIYNAVASSAPNDTWVAGIDGIMRHWDGYVWSRSANIGASPTGLTALSGLLSLGAEEVVGVSTLNLAYRYKGQAFGLLPGLGSNPFDAPQNTAMWTASTRDTYVTNVDGELWHFDGITWSLAYTVPDGTTSANDVWGTDPNDLWLVDDEGRAHHYDGTWTAFDVSLGIPLQRVWTDGTEVWVLGSSGAYRKNGSTWMHYTLGTQRILSISATGPDDVWVVEDGGGNPNKLWHWNASAWVEVQTTSSFSVLAVAAVEPDDVHVTAGSGRMLHWNGSTWSETVIPVLADLTNIVFTAPDDVIAASARDLAHFNGVDWATIRTPVDFVPNSSDYLPIVDLFATPGRIDMMQSRYRVRTLIRTRPLVCRQRETCGDAVDNDCDNLVDTADVMECP